jgi:hypothetical protein
MLSSAYGSSKQWSFMKSGVGMKEYSEVCDIDGYLKDSTNLFIRLV